MTNQVLKGIRIVDFSAVVAGPFCSLLLSSLGAEVIHVSNYHKDDPVRANNNARYNAVNMNRRDIAIDLKNPQGLALGLKLVESSDVVVENLRPGAMDKLGLGYEALKKVKPNIIMVSASGFGATGPFRSYGGFATNFVAASGLSSLIGYAGGLPNEERGPADFRSGQLMALTVMVALLHRQRSGGGQHIDLSMTEAHVCGIGEKVLDYVMNGRIAEPTGNRHEYMAPHNSYRCKGNDAWISIAVGNDKEWLAFRRAMGDPEWAKDNKYGTALLRWKNQEELDKSITAWTINLEPIHAMNLLQQAGVAAMPTANAADIFNDPHFKERHFLGEVTYKNEKQTVVGVPYIMNKTLTDIYKPAPGWGEHTDEILADVLRFDQGEIEMLKNSGVVK